MAHTELVYREAGRRMRQVRESLGLSQEEVAGKLGITKVGYGRWESAERRIHLAELYRVAEVLGHPVSFFLTGHISPDDLAAFQYSLLKDDDKALVRRVVTALIERNADSTEAA